MLFGGNFAPRGWAFCHGQLLPINANQALFSILGTTYGGDGRTTFALPDLRGRMPIGDGNGPGLTARRIGQKAGAENVTLNTTQIPAHNHQISNQATADTSSLAAGGTAKIKCNSAAGNSQSPEGNYPAATTRGGDTIYSSTGANDMNGNAVDLNVSISGNVNVSVNSTCGNTGSNSGHENMQPWLCMNYVIALDGIYPSRS